MRKVFSTSFSSELGKMKEAVNMSLGFIKYNNPYVSADNLMDLRLIFSELLTNAVIHGNEHDAGKKVYIVINSTEIGIMSKITDEGNGFRYKEKLEPKNELEDFFSESGRGLKLVSALTDELTFMGKGNIVKFSKRLALQMQLENDSAGLSYASNY